MKENEKKVTNGDCNMLARAIGDLISSVPKMKIGTLTYFKKIQKKLDVINSKAFKAQQEILKKHVKSDGNGGLKLTEPTQEEMMQGIRPEYIYKNEDAHQKGEVEMKKLLEKVIVTKFEKIHPSVIAHYEVNPSMNPMFSTIMEMLLLEEEEQKLEAV